METMFDLRLRSLDAIGNHPLNDRSSRNLPIAILLMHKDEIDLFVLCHAPFED